MYCYRKLILVASLAYLTVSAIRAQSFTNVASDLGIDEGYGFGESGGGVSFCDFNGDDWDDLTFSSQAGEPVYFYLNIGNNNFLQLFLIDNTLETKDITWVDYDNDGDRDLFVTAFNGLDRLYENQGGLTLVDVTQTALPEMSNMKSMGAVWGDYDRDGWLDLYICHYYFDTPHTENDLYRNLGDGTFSRVTAGSPTNNGIKLTFDACFVDLDENGWQDLYVVNDKYSTPNALYMNTNGSFQAAPEKGADIAVDAMNAGGGDYDDDGDFDLYISNCIEGNLLFSNDGAANFTNTAPGAGVEAFRACWGANFFDFDLDTDQDLYVCAQSSPSQPNAFFVNTAELGTGNIYTEPLRFSGGLGGEDIGLSYGNAIGDLNDDGLLDIAVCQSGVHDFLIWQNDEVVSGNWLKVVLTGTTSNLEGIGARVEVEVGGETMTRYRQGGEGYLSQNSSKLHFGLGDATQIDEMRVIWPSGIIDVYEDISDLNQIFSATEGEAALPAELIAFSAYEQPNSVRLEWISAQETDLAYYEVERSLDGRHFTALLREQAVYSEGGRYSAEVLPVAVFPQYYHLRMVDFDGSTTYSQIVLLDKDQLSAELQVGLPTPNPVSGVFQIPYLSPANELMMLDVFNSMGQLVYSRQLEVAGGEGWLTLDTDNFSETGEGLFFLHLNWKGRSQTIKIAVRP